MNNAKYARVFIEYIHPSKRDLGAPKTLWDIASRQLGWRHARVIVTKEPVRFISSAVKGSVYDAGKSENSKLVPMYEDFTPTALNSYLPIGGLKANVADNDIKNILGDFLKKYPDYDFTGNNCEFLARTVSSEIIDGPYPKLEKMKGKVYPVALGAFAESMVPITVEAGFEDAAIYDPDASLGKGSGPFNIVDIIMDKFEL